MKASGPIGRSVAPPNVFNPNERTSNNFACDVCLPFLLQAQNADGGWGYRPRQASATEPTAWCLLALAKAGGAVAALERGRNWLAAAQQAVGSWPTRPETVQGNWVTALAGLALGAAGGPREAVARAANWVCGSQSRTGGFRARLGKLLTRKAVTEQDDSLRGWSWTPGTAGWVEPTSVSLIFLREFAPLELEASAVERRRMGEAMLYNRMCPGGGWNTGNPKVYGVPGIPQPGPTAWALLALAGQPGRDEIRRSLDWLARNYDSIAGVSSLALGRIALQASGRQPPRLEPRLATLFAADGFLDDVTAFAQATFALGEGPDVLRAARATG
ncbi:MAG TPA: prenyltransferase/squalene oxidase repeat-containing protein [Candidatus Acidoferrales bacterium]|nr:prenyltransferase/squalene oxidase repeat-containing protein [Candidatus Acidoferrales bacterium]